MFRPMTKKTLITLNQRVKKVHYLKVFKNIDEKSSNLKTLRKNPPMKTSSNIYENLLVYREKMTFFVQSSIGC